MPSTLEFFHNADLIMVFVGYVVFQQLGVFSHVKSRLNGGRSSPEEAARETTREMIRDNNMRLGNLEELSQKNITQHAVSIEILRNIQRNTERCCANFKEA